MSILGVNLIWDPKKKKRLNRWDPLIDETLFENFKGDTRLGPRKNRAKMEPEKMVYGGVC